MSSFESLWNHCIICRRYSYLFKSSYMYILCHHHHNVQDKVLFLHFLFSWPVGCVLYHFGWMVSCLFGKGCSWNIPQGDFFFKYQRLPDKTDDNNKTLYCLLISIYYLKQILSLPTQWFVPQHMYRGMCMITLCNFLIIKTNYIGLLINLCSFHCFHLYI